MAFDFTRPLGFLPGFRRPDEEVFDVPLGASPVPRRFRLVEAYPDSFQAAVEDQRQTSSCVGNACVSLMEFLWHRKTSVWANFSRMMAYYWARLVRGWEKKDVGSFIGDCVNQMVLRGLSLESYWRFREELLFVHPDQDAVAQAARHKALRPLRVPRNQVWNVLSGNGDPARARPVVIGITVYNERVFGSQAVRTGEIALPRGYGGRITDTFGGGHAIMLAGYDLDEEWGEGPNSWSRRWGTGSPTGRPGWFRVHRKYIEDPNLSSDFWTFEDVEVGQAA